VGLGVALRAIVNSPEENKPEPWNSIDVKYDCSPRIKNMLRDPDSFQFVSATVLSRSGAYGEFGHARISFRARNGFNGYNASTALCERYEKDGNTWVEATIE